MKFVSLDIETTGLKPKKHKVLEIGMAVANTETGMIESTFRARFVYEELKGQPMALKLNSKLIGQMAEHLKEAEKDEDYFAKHNSTNPTDLILIEQICNCSVCQLTGKAGLNTAVDTFMKRSAEWLTSNGIEGSLNICGKNVTKFDLPFLEAMGICFKHRQRVIDPAILYWESGDDKLPDLKTCMERAGLAGEVPHTAVEDAVITAKLVLAKLKG